MNYTHESEYGQEGTYRSISFEPLGSTLANMVTVDVAVQPPAMKLEDLALQQTLLQLVEFPVVLRFYSILEFCPGCPDYSQAY
jgi:hypothetical protein